MPGRSSSDSGDDEKVCLQDVGYNRKDRFKKERESREMEDERSQANRTGCEIERGKKTCLTGEFRRALDGS